MFALSFCQFSFRDFRIISQRDLKLFRVQVSAVDSETVDSEIDYLVDEMSAEEIAPLTHRGQDYRALSDDEMVELAKLLRIGSTENLRLASPVTLGQACADVGKRATGLSICS